MDPKITWVRVLAPFTGPAPSSPGVATPSSTLYEVRAYDTSGVRQASFIDFRFLSYKKAVNAPGFLQLGIRGDHPLVSMLQDKWQLEVWRKPSGEDWARDFVALFRQPEWAFVDRWNLTLLCPGLMSMLDWRIINWPADVSNRTRFSAVAGETIMKTLVSYNAGSSATTGNGRKRNGAITGLTVEADGAAGNTVTWYCAQKDLLDNLQKLSDVAGGDFDLVKTSSTAWQFRWGTWSYVDGVLTASSDRSNDIIFSIERGNMSDVRYRQKRMEEKTVACVWGQGEGAARDYVTRTGPNYGASNDIEMYVDAKDVDEGDTAGLNAKGDQKLVALKATDEFQFTALQTRSALYGVHYFLGDTVAAVNPITGTSNNVKAESVTVSLNSDGNETVVPMFQAV